MKYFLKKMTTEYKKDVVDYFLEGEQKTKANELIGKEIEVIFNGKINCISCGNGIKKTYGQGFCYTCFSTSPMASECIFRPELCEAHLGKGRDVQWEETHHNREHYIYLAVSSAVKVGITNHKNIPYRWIDQGASYAIKFAKVPYRKLAGDMEVVLKEHFTDKTNWRKMLTNEVLEEEDLEQIKWEFEEILPSDLSGYMTEEDEITYIKYPVLNYPKKVKSISLDKTPFFSKKLIGIKGQYFIFNDGSVLNIRKYTGYCVEINS